MALARLGYGDEAVELFHMINPINHTRDARRRASATRPSPTSWPATSTRIPTHMGRGGWTWYTGLGRLDVSRRARSRFSV